MILIELVNEKTWAWPAKTTATPSMDWSWTISSRPLSPHLDSTPGKCFRAISTAPLAESLYQTKKKNPQLFRPLNSRKMESEEDSGVDEWVPQNDSKCIWERRGRRSRRDEECTGFSRRFQLQQWRSLVYLPSMSLLFLLTLEIQLKWVPPNSLISTSYCFWAVFVWIVICECKYFESIEGQREASMVIDGLVVFVWHKCLIP